MPLALLIIGALFLTAAVRGDKCDGQQCSTVLFNTMKSDFTGPNNFIYWGVALFVIGGVGYYKPLKPLSNAFLGLVILVLFFSNRGFFQRFMEQIGSTQSPQSSGSSTGDPIQSGIDTLLKSAGDKGNSLIQSMLGF